MGKRTKRQPLKRTEENQKLFDSMTSRIYEEEKTILVNGVPHEVIVKVCPPFDPRGIAGYESGEDLTKIFNIPTSPSAKAKS